MENDSKTLATIIAKMRAREPIGLKKYGVTVDREDLNALDWLNHLQGEQMDAINYTQRIIDTLAAAYGRADAYRRVIEKIAKGWDDCEYKSEGVNKTYTEDIGESIRDAWRTFTQDIDKGVPCSFDTAEKDAEIDGLEEANCRLMDAITRAGFIVTDDPNSPMENPIWILVPNPDAVLIDVDGSKTGVPGMNISAGTPGAAIAEMIKFVQDQKDKANDAS